VGENVKAFGPYAEWSLLPVALLASLRYWLSLNPMESIPHGCTMVVQSKRPFEQPFVADFEVFEEDTTGVRLFLRGEFKLTRVDAIKMLKEALHQVREPLEPPNALLIVASHGGAQHSITECAVREALSEHKDLEILSLPEGRGCFARGSVGRMGVEAIVCDLEAAFDCLSLGLLGRETLERPEHAIGLLLKASVRMGDNATLAQLLAHQQKFPLDLRDQFWKSKLLLNPNALVELLLNPVDKVLRDFLRMSASNWLRHYRWTRSLINLCRLRLTTPGGHGLDEAIERTLIPLPVRLGDKRSDLIVRSLTDTLTRINEPIRIVIESRPGAGKSTMLGFLKWLETQRVYHHGSFKDRPVISFFLDLQRADRLFGQDPLTLLIQSDRHPYFSDQTSVFSHELSSWAVGVLLANWEIDVFVDGYDHLRSTDDQEALNALGTELASAGARLRRLIVASRPGFQAERLWEHCFKLNNSVIRNAFIDQESIKEFIETWFGLVALFAKDAYDRRFGSISARQATDDFLVYVGGKDPKFSSAVMGTPLLLTIAIAIFFSADPRSVPPMSTSETDLFEELFSGKYVLPGEGGHRLNMNAQELGELSFALLMAEDSVLGRFSDESRITTSGGALSVGAWRERRTLDNVSILDSVEGVSAKTKQWNYIHPAFQEFLASRYFVRGIGRDGSGSVVILNRDQMNVFPMAVTSSGGFNTTNLAEVLTRLGTQALKFVIGNARSDHERLRSFLECLSQDFGLQQYLYDSECLAPAESELQQCLHDIDIAWPLGESTTRIKVLLHKLIGHIHYATFATVGTSRKHLEKVIALCDSESFKGSDWYRLFCHDHIQNRATDEIRRSHTDSFNAVTRQMNPTQMTGVRLRLAHFAGHLGNQALRALDASKNIDLDLLRRRTTDGDTEYTRALELRALTFAQFVAPDAPSALSQARDELLTRSGHPAVSGGGPPEAASSDQEGFVGPSQAIGDFAHQLVGRATIRFWKVVEQRMCNGSDESVWEKRGQEDLELAKRCWGLANHRQIRAVRGERIIKYVIYLAGAETRRKILLNPQAQWKSVEEYLQRQKESVAREFEVSLPKDDDYRDLSPGVEAFFKATWAAYNPTA
jgi:hypothetical protein